MNFFSRLRLLFDSDFFLPSLFFIGLAISGVSLWNAPLDEMGDEALIGLQTIRASHFQEGVGPYSRAGFRHPGPISFYLYAAADTAFVFIKSPDQRYRYFQMLLNAGLFLWFFAIFRRLTSKRAALVYSAIFLITMSPVSNGFYFSIWGPLVLIVPYLLFFAAYTGFSKGHLADIFAIAFSSIFLIQNHIGSVVIVGPFVFVGLIQFWRNKPELSRNDLNPIVWTSLLLIITSLPMLIDQFFGTGNISKIFQYFTGSGSAARRFDVVIVYLTNYYLDPVRQILPSVNSVAWFGFLTGMPLLVWNRLAEIWKLIYFNLLLMFVLSLVGALRVSGDLLPHLFWYLYPFVAFHFLLIIVSLKELIAINQFTPKKLNLHVSIILLLLVFTVYKPVVLKSSEPTLAQIMYIQVKNYPSPYRLVFPIGSNTHNRWVEATGLALKLTREKKAYCIDSEWSFMFPPGSVCSDNFQGTVVRFLPIPADDKGITLASPIFSIEIKN